MTSSPNEISETILNVRVVGGNADGAIDGGTAAELAVLVGGIYNSTPPILTDGEQAAVQLDSSGNLKASIETNIAGERNVSSSTNSYLVVKQECNITRTSGTSEVLVSAAPVHVLGIIAESATAGTCTLRDAAATGGGTTGYTVTTLASVTPRDWDLKGARMETGLTYQVGTGGNYLILWRPIG
jgi:hypothetical protein